MSVQDKTSAALTALLSDPERLKAIQDDPIVLDVLKKLFCMRKLAEKDPEKRSRIAKLQRFVAGDRNDMLLRDMWDMADMLTRAPSDRGSKKLKKSKSSVLKKSRSMVMSAKDIPMNAFLAMKGKAEKKDESWLKNFMSESIVDDVPWECSKALIIMKEGFQAIIPREASRSILMGDASYTLIDDSGIEFFLSPMDKRKRRLEGKEDTLLDPKQQNGGEQNGHTSYDVSYFHLRVNLSSCTEHDSTVPLSVPVRVCRSDHSTERTQRGQ